MKTYIKALIFAASLTGLTACNDYLDLEPEDQQIPEIFFKNASNLTAYCQNYYGAFTTHSSYSYALGTFSSDNGTDNQVGISAPSRYATGSWTVGSGDDNWSFTAIRQLNFFFEYAQPYYDAGTISGSADETRQAMGEAHFFRAFYYWSGYNTIGDYPIIDGVLPDDKGVLLEASKRQPRNKVARYILDDLQQAINLLPETSSKGKQGLNKDCARLFRSRVALFEGTWLKHHKGTALVPGGPGWPGDKAALGTFDIDSEINYFLTEAMASAKEIADKYVNNLVENTDTPEGQGPGFAQLNPYYNMFCQVNLNGFSEVLMYKNYVMGLQTTQMQNQFQRNAGGSGWTRGLVNSFLMSNGLPIYAAGSGYDANWENQGVTATLQNRDSRIRIFTKGDNSIVTYGMSGNDPAYWREGWLLDGTGETKTTTGYAIKKGQDYDYSQANANLVSLTGSIIFRASEALLNYMEACVEKNGSVDATADSYWRALRNRAKVDPDYTKTISATNMTEEAKWDWGAYSHGALVNATLYNVRRERRNELIAEGLRYNDLRRWCAMDQLADNPYQIEGMKYWGTVYADQNSPLCLKSEAGTFLTAVVSPDDGRGTMSAQSLSDYVRPFQITRLQNLVWNGLTWTRAHYLSPIGYNAMVNASPTGKVDESVIYQNPGWPTKAGQAAFSIN